uniref:Neprilysin n=1 Tax=Hadrurus spadix TaxID=141984 RepID=A0A1W7RA40_9SCOR
MTPFTDIESNGNKMRSISKKSKKEEHLLVAVVILAVVLFAFVIAVIVLAVNRPKKHPTSVDVCTTSSCLSTALELLDSINSSADPCEDFYEYACGKWIATYSGLGSNKLQKAAINSLFELNAHIQNARKDPEMPSSVRKISQAYHICSEYRELTETDAAWLRQTLQLVGGWPMIDKNWDETKYHWERNLAQAFHSLFITTPFSFVIDVNPFDTNTFIIQIFQQLKESMKPWNKASILSVARRIGNRVDNLENEYQEMEKLIELLQMMTRTQEILFDPKETKIMTIKDIQRTIPWVNWLEFLRTIFGSYLSTPLYESDHVMLIGTTYISKFLERAFKNNVTRRTLANYIAAAFIQSLIDVNVKLVSPDALVSTKDSFENLLKIQIPQGFSEECHNFLAQTASRAIDFINYKNRKTEILDGKTISYFSNSMKDLIEKASWLDGKTKSAALEKLNEVKYFSGFPEVAKHNKTVEEYFDGLPNMTDNPLRNQLEIKRHSFKKRVELIQKKVDRNVWPEIEGTHASQANAFCAHDVNSVVIPAGIQTYSVFAPDRPKFWNFGSFGWIIAHEISHSFDTIGSKKDKYGNMKNWWTPKATQEFERRSRCFIEQYNKIPYGYKDYYVNGTQTLPENVADNGGLRQAILAYKQWEKKNGKEKRLPGLEKYDTYQLFYLATAQPYCSTKISTEQLYNTYVNDTHSPLQFRFNAAASNSEDFAKTFKCKLGTPMNPVKKCVIW